MKKIILLLIFLYSTFSISQTSSGMEQEFDYGIKNNSTQTVTSPTYLTTTGADGTQGKVVSVMNQNAQTGVISFDGLAVNTDPTKYNIGAGVGYISNPQTGEVKKITWSAQTAQTTPYLATSVATYVLKNNLGTTVLQNSYPSPEQFRTHIYLGKLAHTTFTTILFAVTEPNRAYHIAGDFHDLVNTFGSLNRSGNAITPNGANLQINVSAGETYREGANFLTNRNSPNITTEPTVTATSFRNKFRNGSGGWNAVNTTTVDPNYYDNGSGILQLVPNNKFTVKVVYRFGGTGTIHMDYGQVVYDDLNAADAGIANSVASDPDTKGFASRIGWIIIKQGTTSLLDATKYRFVPADLIGERAATSSPTPTLQAAYDGSVTPQIVTSTGGGAVAIRRGSAADTDTVLAIQNGAGTNTFSVTGAGVLTASNKQNSLAPDGTGLKFPTVDAVNGGLTLKEDKQSYIVYADDYLNLTDAINATPQGGTLILGNHTYTGNISISRNNINIQGSLMPSYNPSDDSLLGGTIINGTFVIDGSNVSLRDLGVDSGTSQCIALNSGNPMEGLILHDVAAVNLNTNNRVENVIAIVKENTTMHALLFEGLVNSTFRNVHGKGGDFGVVFKVADSNASEIYGYESRTTNVYIKSDSYAPCLRSNFNNINSLSNVITASQPVAVHASTSDLYDVNVSNVNIYGGERQFRLIASPSSTPTYAMSNVNVSNVVMENGEDVGLDLYGIVYNSAFNNILVRNTISGQGVFSDFNGRGINFNNIRFDDNSGNNLDTAIDIRSYSVLNNIVSIRNSDQTSLGGINLNNFANTAKIGIYVGNLKINGVNVNKDKLTGQGTPNYMSKYDTAGILKNSLFYDDGLNSGFNASPYSLGSGWSLFSTNNTTGSGVVNQVGSIPALRSISGGSNSSIIELRNLPLNFGTNASVKQVIHPSGGVSIGNSTDLGAGTLNVSSNVTTIAGTTANHAVIKSQLDLKADLASPTFTGTPIAPTATAGTNTTQIATTAFVQGIRPYKVYTALLTQTGTNAPVATVLENTLGGTVTWSRTVPGGYFATLSDAFTTDKTTVLITNGSTNGNYIHGAAVSTTNVNIIAPNDGQIDRATVEIRVYN